MSDYPKLVWVGGVERTVHSEAEEAAALAPAPAAAPEPQAGDDEPEGPTFGPPGDDTHAKRARKKR